MEPEELLKLDSEDRETRWQRSVEDIYEFFNRHPSYGGVIHSGMSDLFAAIGMYSSDLIFIVNQSIMPFRYGDDQLKPKNDMWQRYADAEEGRLKEKLYLSAHNMDLESITRTELARNIEENSSEREKAFYHGLIDAAHLSERLLYDNSRTNIAKAYSRGAEIFIRAFLDRGEVPIGIDDAELFIDAVDINPLEVLADQIEGKSQREVWAARAFHTLKGLSPLLSQYVMGEIKELCREVYKRKAVQEKKGSKLRHIVWQYLRPLSRLASGMPYFYTF